MTSHLMKTIERIVLNHFHMQMSSAVEPSKVHLLTWHRSGRRYRLPATSGTCIPSCALNSTLIGTYTGSVLEFMRMHSFIHWHLFVRTPRFSKKPTQVFVHEAPEVSTHTNTHSLTSCVVPHAVVCELHGISMLRLLKVLVGVPAHVTTTADVSADQADPQVLQQTTTKRKDESRRKRTKL